MSPPDSLMPAARSLATQPAAGRVNPGLYIDWLRRDAAFYGFVAAYAMAGLLLGVVAGVPQKFVPFAYIGAIPVVSAIVIGGGLWALSTREPFLALRQARAKANTPRTVAALILFATLSVHMGVFTSVKTMLPELGPFYADPALADFDRFVHGRDPWLYTSTWLPAHLTPLIESLYFGIWGVLLPGSLLAVLLVPKLENVRAQYIWTVLLIWPLLGNITAGAFMSAGPVYYELVTGEPRFAGLVDYLARHSLAQIGAQDFLWQSHMARESGAGSGVSAFPSMHLAAATLFVLLANRVQGALRWAAVAYCAIVLFGSVHLGWHYAIDGYFSILATLLIWWGVGRAIRPVSHLPGLDSSARATTVASNGQIKVSNDEVHHDHR